MLLRALCGSTIHLLPFLGIRLPTLRLCHECSQDAKDREAAPMFLRAVRGSTTHRSPFLGAPSRTFASFAVKALAC